MGGEEEGIRNGFEGFEEVKGLGAGTNEGIAKAVSFGENEQAGGGSFVQGNAQKNESAGGKFLSEGDEFGQFLCAGGAPSGPKIEQEKFAVKGSGIERLAREEVGEG